jgi:hypothetical protein
LQTIGFHLVAKVLILALLNIPVLANAGADVPAWLTYPLTYWAQVRSPHRWCGQRRVNGGNADHMEVSM